MRGLFYLFCFVCVSCGNSDHIGEAKSQSPPEVEKISVFPADVKLLNIEDYPGFSLDRIMGGYDSLQMRVWILNGLYGSTDLFIIRNDSWGWSGQYLKMQLERKFAIGDSSAAYRSGPWPFIIESEKRMVPRQGWKKLRDKLQLQSLESLPNMDQLNLTLPGKSDGILYYLEYATRGNYHLSIYSDVQSLQAIHPKVKQVADLVAVLRLASGLK